MVVVWVQSPLSDWVLRVSKQQNSKHNLTLNLKLSTGFNFFRSFVVPDTVIALKIHLSRTTSLKMDSRTSYLAKLLKVTDNASCSTGKDLVFALTWWVSQILKMSWLRRFYSSGLIRLYQAFIYYFKFSIVIIWRCGAKYFLYSSCTSPCSFHKTIICMFHFKSFTYKRLHEWHSTCWREYPSYKRNNIETQR